MRKIKPKKENEMSKNQDTKTTEMKKEKKGIEKKIGRTGKRKGHIKRTETEKNLRKMT